MQNELGPQEVTVGCRRTTRECCEGVTCSSLTCAAFAAEDMTLLPTGVGMTR